MTYLCTMPPWSSSPAESDGAAEHPAAADSCRECIGWTTYTTAMRAASEPPRCIGLVRKRQGSTMPRMPSAKAAEEMDIVEQQSFKYTCVGTSLSGGADMQNAGRLPACRGIKIVAVRDPAEADAVSGTGASTPARGVGAARHEHGSGSANSGARGAAEHDRDGSAAAQPRPTLNPPPAALPSWSPGEYVGKLRDSAQRTATGTVKFWDRTLDGFGDKHKQARDKLWVSVQRTGTALVSRGVDTAQRAFTAVWPFDSD